MAEGAIGRAGAGVTKGAFYHHFAGKREIFREVRQIALIDARWVLEWEERARLEAEYGTALIRMKLERAGDRGRIAPISPHATAVLLAGALNEGCLLVAIRDLVVGEGELSRGRVYGRAHHPPPRSATLHPTRQDADGLP